MKLRLPDALHARPANLLVRAASQLRCDIAIEKGGKRANAKNILQVLALGAAKGDDIELTTSGDDAEAGLAAIAALVERNFDADLVPEVGASAAPGIALGEAIVIEETDAATSAKETSEDARLRTRAAFARAKLEVERLVASLPAHEGALFEPELAILDALSSAVSTHLDAGMSPEEAVRTETAVAPSDLIGDARARLLDALGGGVGDAVARALEERTGPAILVLPSITPSRVASLPANVVGVIASLPDDDDAPRGVGDTSHAAILARGRGLPLAFVPEHVAAAIEDRARVLLDTTTSPARVWVDPSEALIAEAMVRKAENDERAREDAKLAEKPLLNLGVAIRVNVGSTAEAIPLGAEGVGLLRTELVFGDRTQAPSEDDQVAALIAVARRADVAAFEAKESVHVNVRLFDAGGDKPLAWIPPPEDDPGARGIALLFARANVLDAQLRAIVRASSTSAIPLRILIPLVRSAADVARVRAAASGVPVGAMIETREAADDIAAIAAASDYVCIGTNDLTASVLGLDREREAGDALHPDVLDAVARVVREAGARGKAVTVCGEIAADPNGARILIGLGVRGLSVATTRFASLKAGLHCETLTGCQALARAGTSKG